LSATIPQVEPIRIYADAISAAELMRRLIGNPHVDPRLGEEDGRWYVELRLPSEVDGGSAAVSAPRG
jgi:hypothetical protein